MKDVKQVSAVASVYTEHFFLRIIGDGGVVFISAGNFHNKLLVVSVRLQFYRHIQNSSVYAFQRSLFCDLHSVIAHRIRSVCVKLAHRLLDQLSVPETQLSGNRKLSKIFHSVRYEFRIAPCLHPGHHHSSAVRREHGLWSVKVNPAVNGLYGFSVECMRCFIIRSGNTERTVSHMIFQAFRHHRHGAYHQHMLSVQFKEIRTFPHSSQLFAAGIQNVQEFPVESVLASEQKNIAGPVPGGACRHSVELSVVLLPDLRIPEILRASAHRDIFYRDNGISLIFHIIPSVSHGHALSLVLFYAAVRVGYFFHARIHDQMAAVIQFQSASGKAAEIIVGLIRSHDRGPVFPRDQVFADGMSPVHGTPLVLIGIILVKQMVFSLIEGKSVGIVDPSSGACHMVTGTFCRSNLFHMLFFIVSSLL